MTIENSTAINEMPVVPQRRPFASIILQAAALVLVLAVAPFHVFELDRFFVPKELVLHLAATICLLTSFRAVLRHLSRRDLLLIAFLAWSVVSSLLAQNMWAALRATTVSVSAVALYWVARVLQERGAEGAIIRRLALAVALIAAGSLLQTYGVQTDLFSENRAPGGTTGNRNFVAHAAAFGWPLLLFVALQAKRKTAFLFWSVAIAAVTATLVLTRSRGAWLAFAIAASLVLISVVASPAIRRDRRVWLRLFGITILSGGGVAAALLIPNTLQWRSDNPYLDTVKRVADYQEGSGRGRLIQYQRTLLMAARHPVFGVGPGNWPVEYPRRAPKGDPSLDDSAGGMTSNPWPSSDWVAFVAERGMVAAALLALFFGGVVLSALRRIRRSESSESAQQGMALLAALAATIAAGAFDAVLLLALPAFIIWTLLGIFHREESPALGRSGGAFVVTLVLLLTLLGSARSIAQLAAMEIYVSSGSRERLQQAASIDPGNYRIRMRLASGGKRSSRCEHARAALELFPTSSAAQRASRGCE